MSATAEQMLAEIDAALNAYGRRGPWRNRRGFDSLVQMSCGIAEAGARWAHAPEPHPLPVQALDHASGYLLAAAALTGLRHRTVAGSGSRWRLSLARTADLLMDHRSSAQPGPPPADVWSTTATTIEPSDWGPLRRLPSPLRVGETGWRWSCGARQLGSDRPV